MESRREEDAQFVVGRRVVEFQRALRRNVGPTMNLDLADRRWNDRRLRTVVSRLDKSAIAVAYDSAHGLLELIGDILDVVRIESGHVSLSPKRANLREMTESVARVFNGLARQKTLQLRLWCG